jgi:uncharacterized glyoxalase superfamily protein PhnB
MGFVLWSRGRRSDEERFTMIFFSTTTACFPVADISTTMRWYEERLGFEADPFPQAEPYVFCILRRDNIEIMLQRIDGYRKPELYHLRNGGVWDAYIRIKGVQELFESVRDHVDILLPLGQRPYGMSEFEVRDPNGYVLVFAEAVS